MVRDVRRVLVLDGDQPAALSIVRSLGRRGMTVDVGERGAKFLSAASRYVHDSLIYPDPLSEPRAFVEAIAERIARVRYDLVIPVAEDTLQPLAAARDRLEPLALLAIAPTSALEVMTDKARTFELAASLGVPIPESRTFASMEELAAAQFTFPVVLKPSRSITREEKNALSSPRSGKEPSAQEDKNALSSPRSGKEPGAQENKTAFSPSSRSGRAPRVKLNVMYAHDRDELLRLAEKPLQLGDLIVQEYFRGTGVGVELLADHGEVIYSFQHKRLHELPLTGGGSCLRESMPVNPMLLEHARKLMRATGWHGVAMVEFKLDEATNHCRLMEVNGRFWGSLPLAVAAGADFPYYLVELLTRGRHPNGEAPPKPGILARKLSADVYWYVQVLRPDQDEPLIRWPSKQEILRDTLLTFSPRHHFDVQTLEDPKPGLIDAAKTGAWVVDRALALAGQAAQRTKAGRERKNGAARKKLAAARSVLFVCYGNINRSALAEHHLRALGDTRTIHSAGFHEEANRPADPTMVEVASARGLDLSASRSKAIDAKMIDAADLILAMELKHLERLHRDFPSSKGKAHLLSSLTTDPAVPLEIGDPYGHEESAYVRCFEQVTACTRAIVDSKEQTH